MTTLLFENKTDKVKIILTEDNEIQILIKDQSVKSDLDYYKWFLIKNGEIVQFNKTASMAK